MGTIVPSRQTGVVPSTRVNCPTIVPTVGDGGGAPVVITPLHWWRMDDAPGAIPSGSAVVPDDSGTDPEDGNQLAPVEFTIITPSPVGAAFGNALGIALPPGGALNTLVLPTTPSGVDFTAFVAGLTLDMWIGGTGGGLVAANVIRLRDGSGGPNFEVTVDAFDLLTVGWFSGGAPNSTPGIPVPGISTTPKHVRVVLPNTAGGVLTVVPDSGAHFTQAFAGVPDIFGGSEDFDVDALSDIFLPGTAFVDEIALFNGVYVGPTGAGAVPTMPGVWPGIP